MRLASFVLSLVVVGVVVAWPAAAERPGSVDLQVRLPGPAADVAVGGDGRIFVAEVGVASRGQSSWVRAYLPDGTPYVPFGDRGQVRLEGSSQYGLPDNLLILLQPDGRILLADALSRLRRLNADGSADATFGSGGGIPAALSGGSRVGHVALQPDGRIVVVGMADGPAAERIAVARYLRDGSLDPTFGTPSLACSPRCELGRTGVAVQSDGGIVVTAPGATGPLIARLLPNGSIDPAFGEGGGALRPLAVPPGSPGLEGPARPVALPDGRIRVAGTAVDTARRRMALIGLTQAGRPDDGFSGDGLALAPTTAHGERAIEVERDARGSLLLAGAGGSAAGRPTYPAAVVRRFRANGRLDRSFGDRGVARFTYADPGWSNNFPRIAVQGDDGLVLTTFGFDDRDYFPVSPELRRLHGGYDVKRPVIRIRVGCRRVRVRVIDQSGMERLALRANGRPVRATTRKRMTFRRRPGVKRLLVVATDLADNKSRRVVRLRRC